MGTPPRTLPHGDPFSYSNQTPLGPRILGKKRTRVDRPKETVTVTHRTHPDVYPVLGSRLTGRSPRRVGPETFGSESEDELPECFLGPGTVLRELGGC